MRKFLSLLVVVVALFASQSVSAQKSKLVGKWNIDFEEFVQMNSHLGMLGEGTDSFDGIVYFNFERNGKGSYFVDMSVSLEVEEGVMMQMNFEMIFDLNWKYKRGTLALEYNNCTLDIKSMTITPSKPEYDALIEQFVPVFEDEMAKEFLSQSVNNNNDLSVVFIDKDSIIATGSYGYMATLKRAK